MGGGSQRYGIDPATYGGMSRSTSGQHGPSDSRRQSSGGNGSVSSGGVETEAEAAKRRKIQRACDVCRRKKIKCDGPMNSLSTSKCAHCQEYGNDCTYVEAAKRRGPPKGYIEAIEQRCARLEQMFRQLHPGVDLTEFVGPSIDREDFDQSHHLDCLKSLHIPIYPQMKPFLHALSKSSSHTLSTASPASSLASPASGVTATTSAVLGPAPWETYERDPSRPSDDPRDEIDAAEHVQIAEAMNRLDIHDGSWRFHGKSSLAHLIRQFNSLKYKTEDGPAAFLERVAHVKREEYWKVPEWEVVVANEGVRPVDFSVWPAPGLDQRLIEAYFEKVNAYLPLLNRVIFNQQYEVGSYKVNHEFAKVCLMVFANGARFINDDESVFWPRDWAMTEEGKQRLKDDTDGTIKYSGGWVYMRALLRIGRSIAQGPNLYDFQTQVLVCAFLQGAAVPHLMWVLSGLGLRSAQEIGIHVRSTLMLANPIERALYNRAFWCLYHIDRVNCAAIGRSVALQDADFDADYPIPVDDEYWSTGDPDTDFVQPEGAGLPKVASFIHMLKLDHVLGAALRTIYAITKLPENQTDTMAQRAVVVELDSALNAWADSVPDGLRWDPTRADQSLFEKSAMLYSQYYFCQILIHRPFIPTPQKPETIGLPSLAICSNAARSIASILDALIRRGRQFGALPGQAVNIHFLLPAWTAAVILLVSIYSVRQQKQDRERAMMDVRRCIAATREMEMTWRQAGKLTDVLLELASDRLDTDSGAMPPPPVLTRSGGGKRAASDLQGTDLGRTASHDDLSKQQRGGGGADHQSDLARSSSTSSLNSKARPKDQAARSRTSLSESIPSTPLNQFDIPDCSGDRSFTQPSTPQFHSQPQHSRVMTPPNLWMPSSNPNQPTAPLYGADSDRNPSLSRYTNGQPQPGPSIPTADPSQLPLAHQNNLMPFAGLPSALPSQMQNQYQSSFNNNNNATDNLGDSDMLWDSSFLDALNPELFGMGDMSMNSGLGQRAESGTGAAGVGGLNGNTPQSQQGLDNVDDLWAQLFGANSQGIFTPGLGQNGSGFGGGSTGNFGPTF